MLLFLLAQRVCEGLLGVRCSSEAAAWEKLDKVPLKSSKKTVLLLDEVNALGRDSQGLGFGRQWAVRPPIHT